MKLESVALRNFLSHEATDFVPNGARLASLVGSNGAGKSSLIDGALFALYDHARAKTDQLVKLGSSEMSASVVFTFAGQRYRVTRGRSTRAGGKSYLELHVEQPDGGWRPLTADSIRETQALIDQLLHVDADTFTSAAVLQQGAIDRFTAATPAERKRVLGSILGLDRYERAEARARELARDLDTRLAAQRDQVAHFDEQLADGTTHQAAAEHYRHELEEHETHGLQLQAKIAEQRELLTGLDVQLAAAAKASDDVRRLTAAVDEQADRWKAARARHTTAEQQLARAQATLAQEPRIVEAQQRIPVLEQQLDTAKVAEEAWREEVATADAAAQIRRDAERDLATAERGLRELEAQRSDTTICPECGEMIPAGGKALEERIEAASVVQADARSHLEQLPAVPEPPAQSPFDTWQINQELTEARGVAAAGSAIEEARVIAGEADHARLTAAGEMAAAEEAGKHAREELDEAKVNAGDVERLKYRRGGTVAEIAGHERSLDFNGKQQRDAAANLARAEAALEQMAKVEEQRDALQATIDADLIDVARLKRLVTAFGVNGIPARIVESVLPELSEYANDLLAQLRPGMALELRAQRAKKDGSGVVEALDLIVRDDVGERPLSLFSGGERMSVSLALAVGLSRLVARRAGTAIRTLVIDEPDGLDVDARRAFGAALRILAHAGELERILLVSHHEDLAEVGDAVYRVTKNGHGSALEQVA